MTKKEQKNTAPVFDAANEGVINPLQLLQEIEPLLREYFIGDFKIKDNAISMHFKNGQRFALKICEIVH